jgi:L-alanine-DL-glutamate epimerase-like enolase superfamily enzyme
MKISSVNAVLLTGPSTNDPYFRKARRSRSAAFVEIETSDGLVGLGETYAGYFCPEVVPSVVEFFAPILIDQTVETVGDIRELWLRMYQCGNFWCRVGLGLIVLNGIEAALWDLLGKAQEKPVVELLGGARYARLPCYATGGPSNGPADELAKKIEHYLSLGFRAVKIGAGWYSDGQFELPESTQAAAELEGGKAAFIRERFGNEIGLMIDGHMGNSPGFVWDLDTAQAVMRAVAPFKILFFEEPLHYLDVHGYAELCRTSNVQIAAGECLTGVSEWQTFVEHDCCHVGQPDASFIGGLAEFLRVANMLAGRGRRIATHAWGAGGSLMQNIHGGFAATNTLTLEVPPDFGPMHSEIIGESFRMEDGFVLPPQSPGLGIVLTDEMKQKFPFVPGSGEFNSVPGKILTTA